MARVYLARMANPDMININCITPIGLVLVRRRPKQAPALPSKNGPRLSMHTGCLHRQKQSIRRDLPT